MTAHGTAIRDFAKGSGMTITIEQLRAARSLLGWTQADLAAYSGVSTASIGKIETGSQKPTQETLERLSYAFQEAGIRFFGKTGLERIELPIITFEGEGWFLKLLDDVCDTLRGEPDAELLVDGADDRKSPPKVVQKIQILRQVGIKMRIFVEEGNTHLMGPLEEYRYIPKRFYNNLNTLIYADKVALCIAELSYCQIYRNPNLAQERRNKFNWMWSLAGKPERSTADERF